MQKKGNPLALLVGMQTGAATVGTVWRFHKKLKIELPFDQAIALLGIYPKDTKILIQRDTCIPMFIASLSVIAKLWKQPKCPSSYEWIKKMWYIHAMEYYLALKKNENLAICSNMDGSREYNAKQNKSEKDKYHMIAFICRI